MGIMAGFGFQQTVTKYIPKYYFNEPDKTHHIFRKLLQIQLIGSIVISLLCVLGVQFFESIISFDQPQKALLLLVTFLSIIPVSLNTFLSSSLSAIQEFRKLSRTYICTSILNFLLVLLFVFTKQDLVGFLWLYVGISILFSIVLLVQSGSLFQKTAAAPVSEKLFSYSLYAYISTLSSQIVWERSELLFLGLFSNSSQIAIYTLAYSLAVLFISVWGPLNGVLGATTAEVVLTNKQDKLMMITRHGTKYLAILILPLCLLASLFLGDLVGLVYGNSFRDVALLFPFLVISHCVAIIITPAGNIPVLKQEIKKIMFFNLATAAVNIALDFYLISRYQAFGAMLANGISQFFSIGLTLINAKKYRLGIFNKYTVRIFLYNALLAALFIGIAPLGLAARLAIAAAASLFYIYLMLKTAFNQHDLSVLKNLREITPSQLHGLFNRCIKIIERNAA
jgi:O-antigen/teichoic acid export membrane protein